MSLPPVSKGANPVLGVVATTSDGKVLFSRSTDNGDVWSTVPVGTSPSTSTDSLFNRIGSTNLFEVGGIAGQVSAVTEGNETFALWTASVDGVVSALTAVSDDQGQTWQGPYLLQGSGPISDPSLTLMPAGYVVATWRSSDGAGTIDVAPYSPDGRPLENPQPLPGLGVGGVGNGVTASVDSLERLFFAWPSANGTFLQVTGGLFHASQAASIWLTGVQNLTQTDFVPQAGTNNSTGQERSALETKLGALLHMLDGNGGMTGAIQKVEQDLYPRVTNLPLVLGCTGPNPVCGHIHRGQNPSWILNETGPLAANTFLAIYAIWTLEALGVQATIPPSPVPGDSFYNIGGTETWDLCTKFQGGPPCTLLTQPTITVEDSAQGTISPAWSFAMTDPTTLTLSLSTSFPILQLSIQNQTQKCGTVSGTISASPLTIGYGVTVTFGSDSQTFGLTEPAGQTLLTQVTGLPAGQVGDVQISAGATYSPTKWTIGSSSCPVMISKLPMPTGGVFSPAIPIGAAEHLTPNPPTVTEELCPLTSCRSFNITINGTTTLPSLLFANATASSQTIPFVNTTYSNNVTATSGGFQVTSYTLSGAVQTTAGGASINPADVQEAFSPSTTSPPLTESFGCTFSVVDLNLRVVGLGVVDVTSTSAVVEWNTTSPAPSILTWVEEGVGMPHNQSVAGTGTFHQVPLDGLSPFAIYQVSVVALQTGNGCLTVTATSPSTISFGTQALLSVDSFDLPYDSITQEGGGESVYWNLPSFSTSLDSGYLQYYPSSTPSESVNVPIEALTPLSPSVAPQTYSENLSTLIPNTQYNVAVFLNLTEVSGICNPCPITAAGSHAFVYLKDSSGDGLADNEKERGWPVTYEDAGGDYLYEDSVGMPTQYSSNGLVSDYVEKEFGLEAFNPVTSLPVIDTAGSHMLDTWNMTFDLGPVASASLPSSGFEFWNDPSYDPFSVCVAPRVCNYPQPSLSHEYSNISYADGADDSPWAAEQLWTGVGTGNALDKLENLVTNSNEGWLRAATGTYDGERTMTVWGKLSWGANPLATSTPGDGIADGARVNPLFEEQLQIQLPDTTLFDSSLANGDGVAVCFNVNASNNLISTAASNWKPEFQGCTSESEVNSGSASIFSYFLTSPVAQTYQWQNVTVRLLVNTATCTPSSVGGNNTCTGSQTGYSMSTLPLYCNSAGIKFYQFPAFIDMMNAGSFGGVNLTNCGTYHYNDYVGLDVTDVPVEKAPTYLWVPDDNSTLSNLPAGLQRYTGEQSFFQIVANVLPSSAFNLSVPTPWHSSYSVGVPYAPSLVNFLIPRSQFLASPIGKQVLLNRTVSFSGTGNLPVWGQSMNSLECYWAQSADGGCPQEDAQPLSVYSPESTTNGAVPLNCTLSPNTPNCVGAGVVTDHALEAGYVSPSVAGILTFNITSSTDFRALLAGLLVNTTGGVNGTLQDVTDELSSLGLNNAVLTTLATMTPEFNNSGVFGLPVSYAIPTPPPPPTSCGGFGCFFNSLAGVVSIFGEVVTGLVGIVGAVWTAVVQARTFFDFVAQGLEAFAENPVGATLSALTVVGSVLEAALQALLAFVEREVTALLATAFSPIINGIDSYVSNVNQAIGIAYGSVSKGDQVSPTEASVVGMALSGSVFEIGLGIGAVLEVALVVLTPVDIGPSFLVTTLIGLVIGSLLETTSTTGMANQVGSPTGLDVTLLHSMQNYMNTTPPSQDANYSASTETWIEVLLLLSKLPTIMFAFGFLAASVYADESPVLPAIALGLLFVAIAVTLYLLTHPTPNQVLIDVALTISTLLFLIGVHTYQAQVGPQLKTLAGIDLLVATAVFGFSLYEFLERFK